MRPSMLIPVALALLGASFLAVGFSTPRYSDQAAAERALDDLNRQWGEGAQQFSETGTQSRSAGYNDRFFDILERYETRRWTLVDLGYLALAWAAVALLVIALGWRPWRRQSQFMPAAVLTVLALLLFWLGLVAEPLYAFAREQLPYWSDTVGIPIFSSTIGMFFVAPIVSAALLLPFLRRAAPGPLIEIAGFWPPRWRLLPVILTYAPFIFAFAAVAVWSWGASGWATSVAGALLLWLALNAASVWLAPQRVKLTQS